MSETQAWHCLLKFPCSRSKCFFLLDLVAVKAVRILVTNIPESCVSQEEGGK